MDAKTMRMRKKIGLAFGTDFDCPGTGDFSGLYHSVLFVDYPVGRRTDCPWNLVFGEEIVPKSKGGTKMQIVVVKAPKMLRGILRMAFKMKKPELLP